MKKINIKELHSIFEDLRNSDENAYMKLYENYYSVVYGVVFSIIKNKEDSEDIAHEIFTKIYKMDTSKLPTSSEASWLYTVSKNECFSYLRKRKPNISIDEIFEIPSTENELDEVVDVEYFNKLISGLKEDEKMIVSLKVLSNFTFSKISKVMNIPMGTVQWKYYKAINSLKISLGSLLGAIIAFIIVLAKGDLLKKEKFFDGRDTNKLSDSSIEEKHNAVDDQVSNEGEVNETIENNIDINSDESSSEIKEDESRNEIENTNNSSIDTKYESETTKTWQGTEKNSENEVIKDGKMIGIQAVGLTLGIVLLIISFTFFKKYQQKLKIKSSK